MQAGAEKLGVIEAKTMINFLNPAITGRPAPSRVQSASSCKVPSTIARNWVRFA
jgi:hypothetical protein